MTRPTTPAPDAASDDVRATWRVVLSSGVVGTCVPRDCEDESWSAVVRWPDGATSRADGSDAGQAVYRAAVEHCEWRYGREGDAAYIVDVLRPGELSRAELTADLADLARLRAPAADLAAIGARAAAYTAAREHVARVLAAPSTPVARLRAAQECDLAAEASAADVLALLALLAAERECRAAEVAGAREAALREAADIAREEMALWANALDSGSEVAIARHRTASDIAATVAALATKGDAPTDPSDVYARACSAYWDANAAMSDAGEGLSEAQRAAGVQRAAIAHMRRVVPDWDTLSDDDRAGHLEGFFDGG